MYKDTQFLTKSSMNLFGNPFDITAMRYSCPYKFYLGEIKGIRIKEESQALTIGTQFHSFADKFYDNISVDNELSIDEKFVEDFKSKSERQTNILIDNFLLFEQGRFDSLKKLGLNKTHFPPVLREQRATNKRLKIFGYLDRIDRHTDNNYIIIDIKTGKYQNSNEFRQELTFYKLCQEEEHPDVYAKLKWMGGYFPKENSVFFDAIMQKDIDDTVKRIEKIQEMIEEKNFPKNFNACNYCPHFKVNCTGYLEK